MLAECFTDVCLVFGRKVGFFAVETVVFAPAEVGDELVFQCVQVFVGNVVEQVADSPCHMYFLYRLEVGASVVVLGDAQRVDSGDRRVCGSVAYGGKAVQAGFGFRAWGVETAWETVRRQRLFCGMFHVYRY